MKLICLAISLILNSNLQANTLNTPVDTLDFWHVFYNGKLIKQYNGYNSGEPLILKIDSIKSDDSITVKYFRDTPCFKCRTYIIVEYPITEKAFIVQGTHTFQRLTFSLIALKKIEATAPRNNFEVFYLEDTNNYKLKLFEIKLE